MCPEPPATQLVEITAGTTTPAIVMALSPAWPRGFSFARCLMCPTSLDIETYRYDDRSMRVRVSPCRGRVFIDKRHAAHPVTPSPSGEPGNSAAIDL